jgi:hypothetical protein
MTVQESDIRFELRKILQRSIAEVIGEVLNLPDRPTVKYWYREELLSAIARCNAAISTARFFASEFSEIAEWEQHDRWSQESMTYASQICNQLAEEVIFVEAELLIFAQ